jgi:hypothetical protein
LLDSATTSLRHHDALVVLAGCPTDFDTEIIEYTRRDLLNLALGNRDNHGRNIAVLKEPDGTMQPGQTGWNLVLENLATHFEEAHVETRAWPALIDSMRSCADQLEQLPALMADCGVAPGSHKPSTHGCAEWPLAY